MKLNEHTERVWIMYGPRDHEDFGVSGYVLNDDGSFTLTFAPIPNERPLADGIPMLSSTGPEAYVSLQPAMMGGTPCVNGTRLPVSLPAQTWWGGTLTVEEMVKDWPGLTRANILVACWYVATKGSPTWRKRWGAWAEAAFGALWRCDFAEVPMPPQKMTEGAQG